MLLSTATFGVGNELANSLTGNDAGNWLPGGAGGTGSDPLAAVVQSGHGTDADAGTI